MYAFKTIAGGAGGGTVDPAGPAPHDTDGRARRLAAQVRRGVRRTAESLLPVALITVLVVGLALIYLFNHIVIVIRSGEAGALYRLFYGGTQTDYVYPEGIHILWPWNKMHIYNTRVQTVLHEFKVLTNKGLPIELKLAIRYHPEYEMVGLLHQRVGPNYVNTIVVPQIESVLRRNIGRRDPEDIYTNKEGILTDIIVRAIEEAGQKFVYIDDIIIRSVTLPEAVKLAIDEKLVYQQQWQAYEFRLARETQEAERKRIEAQGIRDYQATIAETLDEKVLQWQGIQATVSLSESENSKVVVIGSGENGLPIILGGQ